MMLKPHGGRGEHCLFLNFVNDANLLDKICKKRSFLGHLWKGDLKESKS